MAKKKPLKNRLETIIEKIKGDVTIIKANAAVVIKIATDEQNFSVIENEKGRIKVIAIIGPVNLTHNEQKIHFEEALLCEIGTIRARPYQSTEGKKSERSTNKRLHSRSQHFSLSVEQYKLIAPVIFSCLIKKAKKQCSARTRKGWEIYSQHSVWVKPLKRFELQKKLGWWPRGTRFAISKKDALLLQDVYWAEANLNISPLYHRINRAARLFSKVLTSVKKRNISFRKFAKSKNADELKRCMEQFPVHLRKILMEKFLDLEYKEKKNRELFNIGDIYDFFEFYRLLETETEEEKFIKNAEKIGDPKNRIGNISLTTSPHNTHGRSKESRRRVNDYLIIEVFPFDMIGAKAEDFGNKIEFYHKEHPNTDNDDLSDVPF